MQCVEADDLELATKDTNAVKYHEAWQQLCDCDGVLVPGGFGTRGIEGKILAAEWARTAKKPYLGIKMGQLFLIVRVYQICFSLTVSAAVCHCIDSWKVLQPKLNNALLLFAVYCVLTLWFNPFTAIDKCNAVCLLTYVEVQLC